MAPLTSSSFISEHREDPPPKAGGMRSIYFFDKSEAGTAARSMYLKTFVGGTFGVILMIFIILPIYWGALWRIPAHNLGGWVVDFDGGLIGQTVSQALASNQGGSRVTWTYVNATTFPGGLADVAAAVIDEQTWVAVAIKSGTTAALTAALTTPNASYDGSTAIVAYANEARNENGFRGLIRPSVQGALDVITRRIAVQVAQRVAASPNLSSILTTAPQTIITPVYYAINNLISYDQPVATAATFVGMLFQVIMGFFVVMVGYSAREISGYNKHLSIRGLIVLRLCSSFIAYFFISLFYCLLNLAFQLDVTRKFGHAGFMVFWMVNYIGMLAVTLALESMLTLLTQKGAPFLMLLWIITNLSVCIFPIEVLPHVFRYGYGAPFYSLSRALRTILFATKNHVGESVGILVAWVAISCITLPLLQWFVSRNTAKEPSTESSVVAHPQTNAEKERP